MDVTFYSDADAVAVDQLQERGFALNIYDHWGARRLWVMSIRRKVMATWLNPTNPSSRYLWFVERRGGNLDMWARKASTEELFAQIQRESDKIPEVWRGGFDDARRETSLWSEIRLEAHRLRLAGPFDAWSGNLARVRAQTAELTREELDADPYGVPVGRWNERP